MLIPETGHLPSGRLHRVTSISLELMRLHVCSQCRAVITVYEEPKRLSDNAREGGLCDECGQAQPGLDDSVLRWSMILVGLHAKCGVTSRYCWWQFDDDAETINWANA
jgi:hypothetical protein